MDICVWWMYDFYIDCLLLTHFVSLKKISSFLLPVGEFCRTGPQFILTHTPLEYCLNFHLFASTLLYSFAPGWVSLTLSGPPFSRRASSPLCPKAVLIFQGCGDVSPCSWSAHLSSSPWQDHGTCPSAQKCISPCLLLYLHPHAQPS